MGKTKDFGENIFDIMTKNLVNLFVFINLIFFSSTLNAEIVKKIEISGNSRISDETSKFMVN